MLMIRLSRVGKKKEPSYRVVISEKTKDPWADALEFLGFYNPRTEPKTIDFKKDRIQYWLSKGAKASPVVHNLLVDAKIITAAKIKTSSGKKTKDGERTETKNKEAAKSS